MLIYFCSYFLCAPYFLCVIHFCIWLSHAGNSDSLSVYSPKLASEAYQKMPFLFASDQRTWTLVLLSFIKTNFQILWCTAASRVLVSVFLNHTWPQTFSHCFFVHVMEKHCLNETNRKMLQYPFTAKYKKGRVCWDQKVCSTWKDALEWFTNNQADIMDTVQFKDEPK